jgi:hypothetical protein
MLMIFFFFSGEIFAASSMEKELIDAVQKKASVVQEGLSQPFASQVWEQQLLPQYRRFIKDYKRVQGELTVSLDTEAMRSFLEFDVKKLSSSSGTLLFFTQFYSSGGGCEAIAKASQTVIQDWMKLRGFQLKWVEAPLEQDGISSDWIRKEQKRFSRLSLIGGIGLSVRAGQDNALHGSDIEDQEMSIALNWNFLDQYQYKSELKSFPATENPSFVVQSLLADRFLDLANRFFSVKAHTDLLLIEITGPLTAQDVMKVKQALSSLFLENQSITERFMTNGKLILGVNHQKWSADGEAQILKKGKSALNNPLLQWKVY